MLNRVVLIGRLTKDPELRYTPSGIAVTTFTLAVDRNFKNANGERDTDFIPCIVYRQQAESCAEYLAKGKMASVDGRIQVRSFEGQDGQRRWVTEIIADNVQFLSPKGSGESGQAYTSSGENIGHEVDLEGDDIPF